MNNTQRFTLALDCFIASDRLASNLPEFDNTEAEDGGDPIAAKAVRALMERIEKAGHRWGQKLPAEDQDRLADEVESNCTFAQFHIHMKAENELVDIANADCCSHAMQDHNSPVEPTHEGEIAPTLHNEQQ